MAKPATASPRPAAANWEWRERYVIRGKNKVDPTSPANLMLCFREHPLFKNAFAFNEINCHLELARDVPGVGKVGDVMDSARRQLLAVLVEQQEGLLAGYRLIDNTMHVLAKENPSNAVKRYLTGLEWDGVGRLATWLSDCLGAAATPERIEAAGSRLLLSAVARILEPGCGIDSLWALQGNDGEALHEALEVLFGKLYYRWCDPQLFYSHAVDEIIGKWCINILDIEEWQPQFMVRIKSIARRLYDTAPHNVYNYSPTVQRTSIYVSVCSKFPEQRLVKLGNAGDHFYELIPCMKVDLHELRDQKDQLFAEAMHLHRRKRTHLRAGWRLHVIKDAEREKVARFIAGRNEVTLREVVENAGHEYTPGPKGLNFRYGKLLRSLNMHPVRLDAWTSEARIVYRILA